MDVSDLQDAMGEVSVKDGKPHSQGIDAPDDVVGEDGYTNSERKAVAAVDRLYRNKERGQLTARLCYTEYTPKPTLTLTWHGHESTQGSIYTEDVDAGFVKLQHETFGRFRYPID